MTLLLRGFPDQALDRCRETLALAERESHPLTMALAQWAFSYVHLMRGEPDAGRRWAEREVALSEKYVLPLLLSQGKFQLGWALADQGLLTEGIAAMLKGMVAISATGAEMGMPYFLSILAEAHGRNGQVIEGVALVDRALAVASETGARFQLPELHRARGNLLLRQGPSKASAAEACFTQALQVAREQAVKFPELHAARDLAALWSGQGALQKAHDVLTPVYAWFTEGFDTPDLKEAKALLNELRA
jgi:predicted ATPase